MSATITPYLYFSGRCEEALEFYKTVLGAHVEMVMRFDQSPQPLPPGVLAPGFESKVMHASFMIGGTRIMASDGCDSKSQFQGFSLAHFVENEASAHRVFNALSEGGVVQMPLGPTFWSPCYGMVQDRFQVAWMVMVQGPAAT